jgi:hypothetical protein
MHAARQLRSWLIFDVRQAETTEVNDWRESLLIIGGLHSTAFAAFHLAFWRLFGWREELHRISQVNSGILQVLNLCLTLLLLGLGALVVLDRSEIVSSRVGQHLLVLLSVFWTFRLIVQFVFFRMNHWASWVLSLLFLVGALIYAVPVLSS